MPNRDCLGFKSYLVPHSAPGVLYDFDNEVYWEELKNQKYKRAFWHKTECDNDFGGVDINLDLKLVGQNFWLERDDYDGSEWWECELP